MFLFSLKITKVTRYEKIIKKVNIFKTSLYLLQKSIGKIFQIRIVDFKILFYYNKNIKPAFFKMSSIVKNYIFCIFLVTKNF